LLLPIGPGSLTGRKEFAKGASASCARDSSAANAPGCRPGELKPPGQPGQGRFQRSRIDLIGRHHGQDHRIGQKSGQRQLAVIHRGAFGTGVEIG
jgi:hypothetical protein